jgi:hypothetical protein
MVLYFTEVRKILVPLMKQSSYRFTMKMEGLLSIETLVTARPNSQRNIPEDSEASRPLILNKILIKPTIKRL